MVLLPTLDLGKIASNTRQAEHRRLYMVRLLPTLDKQNIFGDCKNSRSLEIALP